MTADVSEETPNQNEEDSTPELSLADHEDALKKSRWNVFMYLGIAALLFGFALYPFMTVDLSVDEGIGSIDKTVTVWGLPVDGEDFTDIPVKTTVIVQAVPTDVDSIEIFMIENPKGCDVTDGSIGNMRVDLQNGDAKHPNKYHLIENPVESQVYDVEFGVDPGIYCLQVVVSTQSQNYGGINVNSETDIYPTQMPLAIIATLCLAMSAFAFIGAQKHGRFVKSLVEPKMTPTIEDTVLADATTQKIAAGPQGPPSGPTGPPTGPTGPPTGPTGPPAGPTGPPQSPPSEQENVAESTIEQPTTQPEQASEQDVYEDQGNGWFFRKFPDGTYDQTVYVVQDGKYVPYVDPNA